MSLVVGGNVYTELLQSKMIAVNLVMKTEESQLLFSHEVKFLNWIFVVESLNSGVIDIKIVYSIKWLDQ